MIKTPEFPSPEIAYSQPTSNRLPSSATYYQRIATIAEDIPSHLKQEYRALTHWSVHKTMIDGRKVTTLINEGGDTITILKKIPQQAQKNINNHNALQHLALKNMNSAVLGKGTYGQIKLATLTTKEGEVNYIAVKKIKPHNTDEVISVYQEVILQERVDDYAPSVHGIAHYLSSGNEKKITLGVKTTYIAMNLVAGTKLQDALPHLTIWSKYSIALEVAKALYVMHKNNTYHGDLNTNNIMIDEQADEIFLIDFGLAGDTNKAHIVNFNPSTITCIFAPEVYLAALPPQDKLLEPKKADIYAFGALLVIIFGQSFQKHNMYKSYSQTIYHNFNNYVQTILQNTYLGSEIKPIITKMLKKDPNQRPELIEVINILQKNMMKCSSSAC